jgi:pimeloyl-ACP methyl ester carboxylesterase
MNATSMDPGSMTDESARAARMIDIGGRKLAMSCSGSGSPTVVLETGLGAESTEWLTVQHAIQKITRVFRYDRAGRGASDSARRPRSAAHMVDDLRILLRIADIPGPYVLVGHSFGGLLMRLFAHRYRSEVRSLILVDSMHQDQFEVFGPKFPPPTPADPPQLRDMRNLWTGGWKDPASTIEGIDFSASIEQARAIDGLGDLPIRVLTAGTFLNSTFTPPALRPELQQRWEQLQQEFLRLSCASTQIFVHDSGHFMQRDKPRAVIDAIHEAIRESPAH